MLETGTLLSSPYLISEMKDVLSKPGIDHKFVRGLHRCCADAKVFRKSGSWGTFHSDSALVERSGKQYIVVALADDSDASYWLEELIIKIDSIVSDSLNPYRLALRRSTGAVRAPVGVDGGQ